MKFTTVRTKEPVFFGVSLGNSFEIGKGKALGMSGELVPGIGIKLIKGTSFTILFSDNIISVSGVNDGPKDS